jgi:glycosyltransferase involved in cell wall biosynthesis
MVDTPTGVFGWAADEGGCFHYRVKLPLDQLRHHGYPAEYAQKLGDHRNTHLVIVGQRIGKTGPAIMWQHLARRRRNMLVYEVDDDVFNIDPSSERPYYFYSHPETVDVMEGCLRVADRVTVSTEPLAEQIRRYNSDVVVLPNYIDQEVFTLPGVPLDIRGRDEKSIEWPDMVTVGYTSSPTHDRDFNLVRDQLVLLGQRQRNLLYVFLGTSYNLPVPCASIEWIPDLTTYYQHLSFDIGIAPLTRTTFNNSKSYIKALEYAARGIPVVASDEPPYREFVQHGVTGYLAKQPYQFGRYLRDLVNDRPMREAMGRDARKLAEQYTIQQHWSQWVAAYGLGAT